MTVKQNINQNLEIMEKTKQISIDLEIQNYLLNGGQVVLKETIGKNTTILIRMPKGKWIQDNRIGNEDNKFEYLICQDYLTLGEVIVAGWRNNTLQGAKKNALKEHNEMTWK